MRKFPFSRFLIPLLALLLAACLPDGLEIPESDLLRYLERRSGLIAFVGTDGNIYTIDQAGRGKKALTQDGDYPGTQDHFRLYQYLTWSPDSSQVGFVGVSGVGQGYNDVAVFSASVKDPEVKRLFTSEDLRPFYLYWSPDSSKLSFLTGNVNDGSMAFHVVSDSGGDTLQLDQGSPYYFAWSPEGDQLLVHTGRGEANQVKFLPVADEAGGSVLPSTPSAFQAPAWSSDGEKIYLAFEDSGSLNEIIEADRAGVTQRTLATVEGPVAFAIDQPGEHMAYLSEARISPIGFLGRMRVISLDAPEDILETEEDLTMAFFWSPDGEKLAYLVPGMLDPVTVGVSGTDPVPGLTLMILDLNSEVSRPVANFRPTNEFMSILPYFDQYHHSATIWSPDSRYLVLSALTPEDQPAIFVVPASEGRSVRYLENGLLAFWSWD
ncbi:MAG TPA: hypothetical protein VJ768_11225 [Anaerolineales bacterium]|nr:hypothetical protein [Anaerolineales bacterium]